MTNDQIETAATDHASKYPEHLKTDIVLHYGLGVVRGLKEGSSGEGTIYVPTPISQKPEKTISVIFIKEGVSATCFNSVYAVPDSPVNEIWQNKEGVTHWLRPTTLPQELAAKDKEIADLKATIERMAARLQEMAQDAIKAQGHN